MTIRITNATFESTNAGEFESVDDAYRAAISSGVDIAAGEVSAGLPSVIVEIAVDLVGQRYAARGAVAVSTSRMLSTIDSSHPAVD